MSNQRAETGEWGEQVAEQYLKREKGMRLLDRRWRSGHGELDLVMRKGEVMIFVEVRVRTSGADSLSTYRSIRRKKWALLRKTAKAYLYRCPWRPRAVRFDVVGIRRNVAGQLIDLTHWENVGRFGRNFRY